MPLRKSAAKYWPSSGTVTNSGVSWASTSINSNLVNATATSGTWVAWNIPHSGVIASWTNTTNNNVWSSWAGDARHRRQEALAAAQLLYVAPPETAEQRTARIEREAQAAEARRVRALAGAAEREAANRRAEALLRAHLTPEQQTQLIREDWFLIISKSGKKYRINRGRSANVDVLDDAGKVVRSLCAHPRDAVPDADTMLSQALMLKHDEEAFVRMANVHPINHGFRRRQLAPTERAA